jgi:hypothetical protein
MGRACSTNWGENAYRILVGKPERKETTRKTKIQRVNNIKKDLRETR